MEQLIEKSAKPEILEKAWKGIEKAKPGIRIREAARELGSSEAQLLATTVGSDCVRLNTQWQDLMLAWKDLGQVMSLTRNDACILEHKGTFQKINFVGNEANKMATVIGPIETRVFLKNWHVAFAVRQEKNGKLLESIQVFDKSGEAVTKIYLQEKSDQQVFQRIMEEFRAEGQSTDQEVFPNEFAVLQNEINEEDKTSFLADWAALKDTHDFFGMLNKHKVQRYQAVELAAERYTHAIDPSGLKQLLEAASATKLPIMIFAGNRGNLQIHQGKIRTIRILERGHSGPELWLNILDPAFNMHLRMDLIEKAWVVKKPTVDGIVTAVEVFDSNKSLIAQFFGLRKPGIPQKEAWHDLVNQLPRL